MLERKHIVKMKLAHLDINREFAHVEGYATTPGMMCICLHHIQINQMGMKNVPTLRLLVCS